MTVFGGLLLATGCDRIAALTPCKQKASSENAWIQYAIDWSKQNKTVLYFVLYVQ
jgi:hypothetical protein